MTDNASDVTVDDAKADDLLGDVAKPDADASAAADKASDTTAGGIDEDDLLEGKVSKDGEDKKAAGEGADDYGDFKIPEGYEADAELAEMSKPIFKEANLNKEQAQTLVEKLGPQIMAKIGEKQAAAWAKQKDAWAKEAKADPEFGGKNLDASLADVAKARDFFGAEFTAAIKLVGANNHPAILKALAKVGKALSEDTPGFGKPKTTTTAEQRLYPNDQPKE